MMSKPRHYWWSYIKAVIRHYPELCREWEELKTISATPNYDTVGHGSGISKPTEQVALKLLPRVKQQEFDAVREALEETKAGPDGEHKLELIRLVYWKRTHTVDGAAFQIGIGGHTARNWHGDFIRLVAVHYGLLTRDEAENMKKRRKYAPQSQKKVLS